jgi:hypothetical protein
MAASSKSGPAKIVLSRSQDIPFNKLVLSQSNVRRVKAGVSIEALAESIARHSLLQSLTVRPALDDVGQETGVFEVPVGGRRFRALEALVAQKRMNKTAAVPSFAPTASPRRTAWSRTPTARRCIRSTNSGLFRRCARRARARRRSPRRSPSLRPWCASACGWPRSRRLCWSFTPRVP